MARAEWKRQGLLKPDRRGRKERPRKKRLRRRQPFQDRLCSSCHAEGKKAKAQTASWCQGLCKRHACVKGYKAPCKRAKTAADSPRVDAEQEKHDQAEAEREWPDDQRRPPVAQADSHCEKQARQPKPMQAVQHHGPLGRLIKAGKLVVFEAPPRSPFAPKRQRLQAGAGMRSLRAQRLVCPDCAKEGAKSQAQTATWCEGLCQKHARKQGLTHPPKKACEPSATGKKTKLMQDRFGDKLKWAKEEEPEEKEHKEGASQVICSWFDAAPHSNEDDDVDFAIVCAALSTPGKGRIEWRRS